MEIYVSVNGLGETQKKRLLQALAGHAVTFAEACADEAARRESVTRADVVFGNVSPAWLAGASRLRWVQLDSAGVDAYLRINQNRSSPVTLTHLHEFFDRAVSEAALAGMLAFYRQLPRLLRAQPERRWIKEDVEPTIGQLHGAEVVILGAGGIGARLGKLLNAFDCRVRFFARRSALAVLRTPAELDGALATTDVLINTLPHTPETENLLDAARLARLPASALLVNVGRGSALDEGALVNALSGGRLAGAVLDVTRQEPLPLESPLWLHPRVILTQHTGGRFPGETASKVDLFVDNFVRFARGEGLKHRVDTARGY